jgi:hypothetical protein
MPAPVVAASTQPVWLPLRGEDPVSGSARDLSAETVRVVFVPESDRGQPPKLPGGPAWRTGIVESSTVEIDGDSWWLVRVAVGPNADHRLAAGIWWPYFEIDGEIVLGRPLTVI